MNEILGKSGYYTLVEQHQNNSTQCSSENTRPSTLSLTTWHLEQNEKKWRTSLMLLLLLLS